MSMIACVECGAEVSDKAKTCPKCGAPPTKKASAAPTVALVVVGVFVLGCIATQFGTPLTPEQREQDAARKVLARCVDQLRDEMTPNDRKEALKWMCSGLRQSYIEKYQREP